MRYLSRLRFALVLAALIVLLLPATRAFAIGETTIPVGTATELKAAFATASAAPGDYIIDITADINVGELGGDGKIVLQGAGSAVTLQGNGHAISNLGSFMAIDGATLNLGDEGQTHGTLTLSGIRNNDEPGLVYITGGDTTVNMYAGTTLTGHTGNNYYGGGVSIQQGVFHMFGGVIENCGIQGGSVCYGGGVAVYEGGQFIMDDGAIRDCFVKTTYATSDFTSPSCAGGGVWVFKGSSFIMNGGVIEDCIASNGSNAVGGGVAVPTSINSVWNHDAYGYLDSAFVMNGGAIRGCEAEAAGGGIVAGLRYIAVAPLAATEVDPAANPNPHGVTINGGTIEGNSAGSGGGAFFLWIRDPITISNCDFISNTAEEGAGAMVYSYWTNATFDTCTFSENSAVNGDGGALLLYGNNGTGTVLGDCTITQNSASNLGGGIGVESGAVLSFDGDSAIYGNSAGTRDPNAGGADDLFSSGSTVNGLPAMTGVFGDVVCSGWFWDYDEQATADGTQFEYPAGTLNDKLRYAEDTAVAYTPVPQETGVRYLKVVDTAVHQVTFDDGVGDGSVTGMPGTQDVAGGGLATRPADPARSGYTFAGWFTDAGLTKTFDFSTPITAATTLYAKWVPVQAERNPTPVQLDHRYPGVLPRTSDDAPMAFLVAVFAIAVALVTTALVMRRRHGEGKDRR